MATEKRTDFPETPLDIHIQDFLDCGLPIPGWSQSYLADGLYQIHDMGQGIRKRALGCSRIFLGLASKINYREKAENLEIVEAWDFPNASKSGDVGA